MSEPMTPYHKAAKAADKKLPFKSHKETARMLEYACGDLVDAYRIGAEEAQREIVSRLLLLAVEDEAKGKTT